MTFTNLLMAEVLRMRYRKRVLVSILLMLAGGLMLPMTYVGGAMPVTTEEVESARRQAMEEGCPECFNDYLRQPSDLATLVQYMSDFGLPIAFLALVTCILYVGSDFTSGAISVHLTFTPSRGKLLTARTLVSGVLGAVVSATVLMAMCSVTLVWFVSANGFDAVGNANGMLELFVTGTLLGFFAGLVASLAVFLGGMILALGACAACTVIWLMTMMGFLLPAQWAHIFPWWQGMALIRGKLSLDLGKFVDNTWQSNFTTFTRAEALVYFPVVIGLLWVAAHLSFRRRDIPM